MDSLLPFPFCPIFVDAVSKKSKLSIDTCANQGPGFTYDSEDQINWLAVAGKGPLA